MPTVEELKWLQSLPWQQKVLKTQTRIYEWFMRFDGKVYLSFSGGKDSTVLAHIIQGMGLPIEKVFVDTGLEYPEVREFIRSFGDVTIIRPRMRFDEVIRKYGYPIISKDVARKISGARRKAPWSDKYFDPTYEYNGKKSMYNITRYKPLIEVDFLISSDCCDVMKKSPLHTYERQTHKKPIVATMTEESLLRKQSWLKNGCNAFGCKRERSAPMSFWTEQDVLAYIQEYQVQLASIYGKVVPTACKLCTTGRDRTGCIFCAFGAHLEKVESRFQQLKKTHPRQYEYCIGGGGYDTDGLWKPTKDGLGMGHVFEVVNRIYGEDFIKY